MNISFKLCADPRIIKGFLGNMIGSNLLLKEGMYTPSRESLTASFKLFAKKNFLLVNLQIFFIFSISSMLYFFLLFL